MKILSDACIGLVLGNRLNHNPKKAPKQEIVCSVSTTAFLSKQLPANARITAQSYYQQLNDLNPTLKETNSPSLKYNRVVFDHNDARRHTF